MNNLMPVEEDLFQTSEAKRADYRSMVTTSKVAAAASVVPISQLDQQKQTSIAPTTGGGTVATTPIMVVT